MAVEYSGDLWRRHSPYSFCRSSKVFGTQTSFKYINKDKSHIACFSFVKYIHVCIKTIEDLEDNYLPTLSWLSDLLVEFILKVKLSRCSENKVHGHPFVL